MLKIGDCVWKYRPEGLWYKIAFGKLLRGISSLCSTFVFIEIILKLKYVQKWNNDYFSVKVKKFTKILKYLKLLRCIKGGL